MSDMLQEYCDSRGASMRVDRVLGVIRGVKILGLESRNGRSYLPEALAEAAPLYEEAKVNVNHPKGNPAAPRDYQDRIGTIRNVTMRPEAGLFGDLHFNPKHALAEQLIWDAEHAPENVGFSHNVEAKLGRRGDRAMVEAILRVQSVDLVADPATTRGLFESAETTQARPIGDALEHQADQKADVAESLEEQKAKYPELVESIRREQAQELDRLRQEVERLAALDAMREKRCAAGKLLREYNLPDLDADDPRSKRLCGSQFCETLLAAKDEPSMRALIEERVQLIRVLGGDSRPCSIEQHRAGGEARDAKNFVEAIT